MPEGVFTPRLVALLWTTRFAFANDFLAVRLLEMSSQAVWVLG